jgi:digeranylgeranylglycerophospholipid reductase
MQIETPDVVVVGLGPAGSRAAATAAAAGLSVVALERRHAAGVPVQCAEFVPTLIEHDVPNVGAVSKQKIARMLTFIGNESTVVTNHFHGLMIDRDAFDRTLAKQAALNGAECRYGETVTKIGAHGNVLTSVGARLHPKVLIGADGPRSRVGAAIGQINCALIDTRQVTVPLVLPHDATDIFLSSDYRGGYAWLFPKGAVANVGLGVAFESRNLLKPLLTTLCLKLADQRRIGTRKLSLTGGAIPVGGRLRTAGRLGHTAVLLAGDAAGLTNPVTGAGIASAVQSGTLAGRAAADFLGDCEGAIEGYEEELGDIFDVALNRALRRRREVLAQYANSRRPNARSLSEGWIASPQYWAA